MVNKNFIHVVNIILSWSTISSSHNPQLTNFLFYPVRESVNVSPVLVLNTLPTELRFHQCATDSSLYIAPGSVAPFHWATTRSKPVCKLAVKLVTDAKNWTFSAPFDLKRDGALVRRVGSSQHNLFLQIRPFSGMQRVVTVSGALLTANALSKRIQVAVLPTNKSVETGWTLPPNGGYGSTQLFNLGEIDHFRFRIVREEDGQQPWSGIVTPEQLRAKTRVPLACEWGTFFQHNLQNLQKFVKF